MFLARQRPLPRGAASEPATRGLERRSVVAFKGDRDIISIRIPSPIVALARWLRDMGVLYVRSVAIFRCDLPDVRELEALSTEVDIEVATDEDLRRLAPLEGNTAREWLARQSRGEVCLVARSGSAVYGYVWFSRTAAPVKEANDAIDVSRDPLGGYLYNGYVLPASRRKGVLGALVVGSKRWALDHGVSRLYTSVARDNFVSSWAVRRAGFVPIGGVTLVRVLDREWKRVRHTNGQPAIEVVGVDRSLHRRATRR